MKTFLKLFLGLAAGAIIGLFIGGLISVLFTDTGWDEYFAKFSYINFAEGITVVIVAVCAVIFSILFLVTLHEAGHLVAGLLSGYRFVSFRIFNFTFIKADGRLKLKRFAVAGTGGQCLLDPPDKPVEQIPTMWYNLGGLIANLIALIAVLPVLWLSDSPLLKMCAAIFIIIDAIILLMNGIPLQSGGIGNDAYNAMRLKHNLKSLRGIVYQLKSNAKIQQGIRPKDMPAEWFVAGDNIDYKNPLEVSVALMDASRSLDQMDYNSALSKFETLYRHKDSIMPLYVKEIACELAYLRLINGDKVKAEELLDKDLRNYIATYRKYMSSKERLNYAMALYLENDRSKATEIYNNLQRRASSYLLQGEVLSDLALIEDLFKRFTLGDPQG